MELTTKLLLSAVDAAKLISVGRSHFYALHSSGRLGPMPIRLGRRILWNRNELESWVEAGCPARAQWLKMIEANKTEKLRDS